MPQGFSWRQCWALGRVSIKNTVDGKTDIWQLYLLSQRCRNLSCGTGTEADWQLTQTEWDGTERILGCESVRQGNRSQSEWHLSWCTSGFRSEPPPRATHGFHWGYMVQGWPSPVRRKPEAAPPPLHLESCWMPPQQSPLDPFSALIVFFPLFLFGSVADLARSRLL